VMTIVALAVLIGGFLPVAVIVGSRTRTHD
jgi:hypothetical protein